jgi:hypothetical protein
LALALFLCSCAGAPRARFELGHGLTAELARAATTGAPATVLLDERRLFHAWTGSETTWLEVHRALRIDSEEGLPFAQIQLAHRGGEPLQALEARTLLADGSSIPVPTEAFVDAPLAEGRDRQPFRMVAFAFPRVSPGAIVEYRYVQVHRGWVAEFRHSLETRLPIVQADFELDTFRGVELAHRSSGFGPPIEAPRQDRLLLRWSTAHVPPVSHDALAPPGWTAPRVDLSIARIPSVRINGFDMAIGEEFLPDWEHVARRTNRRLVPWLEASRDLLSPAPGGSPRELALEAWRRASSAIDDRGTTGDGASLEEMLDTRPTPAVERALAMWAMLDAWGTAPRLVLMAGADDPDPDRAVPMQHAFEDLLVALDGDLFLDPACLGCEPFELTFGHRGRQGLALTPRGPRPASKVGRGAIEAAPVDVRPSWLTTPDGLGAEPLRIELQVVLDGRGVVARSGSCVAAGAAAVSLRRLMPALHRAAGAERELRERYLGGALVGRVQPKELDGPRAPVRIELEDLLLRARGSRNGDPPGTLAVNDLWPVPWLEQLRPERAIGMLFSDTPSFELRAEVLLRSTSAVSLPEPQRLDSRFGTYAVAFERDGRRLIVTESLSLARAAIGLDDAPAFLEFARQIATSRRRAIELGEPR